MTCIPNATGTRMKQKTKCPERKRVAEQRLRDKLYSRNRILISIRKRLSRLVEEMDYYLQHENSIPSNDARGIRKPAQAGGRFE